jgi:ribosomal protein S18 acetylase RimI-like enzyme
MNQESNVRIIELLKNDEYPSKLMSKYSTLGYYDLSIHHGSGFWTAELTFKPLDKALEKNYQGKLFEDHVNEPKVFAAMLDNRQVGWIELGYDKWNNRMRVWELLVEEDLRRKGIGTLLMKHALKVAKEKGARMLVLETQTNNAPAISFYLKFGFELIGFDTAAYSNEDAEKREVRLEFGLKLH